MNKLNLERLELCEIEMPLRAPFETSFGSVSKRRILIVRAIDHDGAIGYGECTAPEEPFYNHETIDTAWSIICGFVAPLLARRRVEAAAEVSETLAPIKGNRMAIGGVEAAIWDLETKRENIPLWRHLGGTREHIDCGVSIGLQKTQEVLLEKVTHEIQSGYQRIKLKIKPGHDIELVKHIRSHFPDIMLSVDANAAYRLDRDINVFEQLDQFGLLMIEQPLAAGDLVDHAKLQKRLKTSICLDESITSLRDAEHALELGSCRIINIKLGRVGGHSEARAIHAFAAKSSVPVWCGGMLESGIGRAHNIAMSTLPGFTLPGDVSASSRYWSEDIIEPPVTVSREGTIDSPAGPGIGYAVNEARIKELAVRNEMVRLRPEAALPVSR